MSSNEGYEGYSRDDLLEEIERLEDQVSDLEEEISDLTNRLGNREDERGLVEVDLNLFKEVIRDLYVLKCSGHQKMFEEALSNFFFNVLGKRP